MNVNAPMYRVTADDLPDADKKLTRAISPLLDALNRTLGGIISTFVSVDLPDKKKASFTTDATGAGVVTLGGLGLTPSELWVSALFPASGAISAVYSAAWIPLTNGAKVSFFGLSPSMTYSLTVRYL